MSVKIQTPKCVSCGKSTLVEMSNEEWEAWNKKGSHAQTALPQWTPDQRELLISGTHKECWDKMFSDADLEDEEVVSHRA